MPLTPDLCIYLFAPRGWRRRENLFVSTALDWQVDQINEITQIYSKNHLFFRRQVPVLIDSYTCDQFRVLEYHSCALLSELKSIFEPSRGVGSLARVYGNGI